VVFPPKPGNRVKSKQLRKKYSREFKHEAVGLVVDQGDTAKQKPEQQHIRDLENENQRLRMEKDILKMATADSVGYCNTSISLFYLLISAQNLPGFWVKQR
jgi:transposase-like protein